MRLAHRSPLAVRSLAPLLLVPLVLAALLPASLACATPAPTGEVTVLGPDAISFPALVNAEQFNAEELNGGRMPGYHAVVFEGGRASGSALFQARVTDVQVLDALEGLGAEPGNGLTMASWDERDDPDHPAPRQVIAGPPVELSVRWPGREEAVLLSELLEDPGGRGVELLFGGHRELIPEWRSGCIVCLYSCPGSKAGNARYTIRDYVDGATRFRARADRLPPDGTEVELVMRLLRSPG